jgi:trimethylamine--corrinoid protein Co-methyltransferase
MFGTAGCTDAKSVDQQAAIEAALSCYAAAVSGANLVHDIGLVDHADMVSPEMMVLCDEIIGMTRRACAGIEVGEDSLATDLIDRVGPGGNYLTEGHTLAHFREMWFPSLMDRTRVGASESQGRASFSERLNAKTRAILATHRPEPLPPDAQKELTMLVRRWMA